MAQESIVDEIHKIREEYAKKFDYDLYAICRDAYEKQGQDNRKVVKIQLKSAKSDGSSAVAR